LQHQGGHRGARGGQGLPRARPRPGGEDRDLPHPRRVGGRGLPDPASLWGRVRRPLRLAARGRKAGGGEDPEVVGLMSILIDEDTTFIVQGITGREAVNLTRECLEYGKGAKIVGGVTPGRLGRDVHGVPVFDTVENGVKLVVIVTERIPRGDVAQMVELASERGARIIGPNCLGIIVPDVIKMGGIGGPARDAAKSYTPGPVGVVSWSGGTTTEMSSTLTAAGL